MKVCDVSGEELQGSYFINLPSPYFGLDYSTNNVGNCFNTGVVLDVDDFEIEIRGMFNTGDWYILQSKEDINDPNTTYGLVGGPNGNEICGSVCGLTLTSSIQRASDYSRYIKFTCKNGVATLFTLEPYSNVSDTKTGTYTFTPATQPVGIFANIQNGERGNYSATGNAIQWFKIKKAGQVVFYGVFCYEIDDPKGYQGYLYNLLTNQASLPISGILDFQTYDANQILIKGVFTSKQFITSIDCSNIPWKDNSMFQAFSGCRNLTQVSNINNNVTNLAGAFASTNISTAPNIPHGVTNMGGTFSSCSSLVSAPVIPSGVTNMQSTFSHCTSLTDAPTIPSSVTNMHSTFYGCSSLVNAPVIPSGVTNMYYTFNDCRKLTGNIIINSSVVTNANSCFGNTTLTKYVYIPYNSTTYNTFTAAGYDEVGTKEGVYLRDLSTYQG